VKDGYHEIFNDKERDEYINKIFSWINKNRDAGKTDRRN
jgi:alpha-beta hydrolase superfamily lysophospholipase